MANKNAPPRIAKKQKPGKAVKTDVPAASPKPLMMGKGKKKKGAY